MFGGVHALQECDYSKMKARFKIGESLGCLFLGPVVRYDSFTGKLGLRTVKQYEYSAQTKSSKKLQHPVLMGWHLQAWTRSSKGWRWSSTLRLPKANAILAARVVRCRF